ncbi:MAG: glycoside hydrolase family 127 protein [Fimbriimonas sp.]
MVSLALLALAAHRIDTSDFGPKTVIRPVPLQSVTLKDGFWSKRLELDREVTIWHEIQQCELTPRISNFRAAAGDRSVTWGGIVFDDSDLYKVIEAAGYLLMTKRDAKLEKKVDDTIDLIRKAQESDGYLCTEISSSKFGPNKMSRWSDSGGEHELYNLGHLYEAAVAYYAATGKRTLLNVALKSADLVCATFNKTGIRHAPGHQEIELGLVKLYQTTGNVKYLNQAQWFLDERGNKARKNNFGDYSQDHMPVVDQREAVGHSVRAAYMYSAMLDVGTAKGDARYVNASRTIWGDVVHSKIYVTGGIGSSGSNEGFSGPFNLPNSSGYAETCASIANVLWNQRLFMVDGDAKYVDVLERSLYNATLSGYGMDGKLFFYPNPLTSVHGATRTPWFACACCPPNVARIVPLMASMVAATDANSLYLNLYASSTIRAKVAGKPVTVEQKSGFPWSGDVHLTLGNSGNYGLRLRVPGWANGQPMPSTLYPRLTEEKSKVVLKVNGKVLSAPLKNGYLVVDRKWRAGDTVDLMLPMESIWLKSDPRIAENQGRLALQRGPFVYCAEFADQDDKLVLNRVVNPAEPIRFETVKDLGGLVKLHTKASLAERDAAGDPQIARSTPLTMIPYYAWAHRGQGQMTVWLASQASKAWAAPSPTLASTSVITASKGARTAPMVDQMIPTSSTDEQFPFSHWWPNKGTTEWVELKLKAPATVSSVSVYWFDDTGRGECKIPKAWRVLAKVGDAWVPVQQTKQDPITIDRFNETTFAAIRATAVRIEVDQQPNWASGIHEIVIK